MTTSGVVTFSVNRDQIIRTAMLNIGKLDENEVPTATETSDCAMFLNMLVKQWQGKADFAPGLKTWTRKRGYQFLNASGYQYTLGPGGTGWTNSFVTTSTTAAAASGQAVVMVTSVSGMTAGDRFGVEDVNGDLDWYTILTAIGTTVTLTSNLTSNVGTSSTVFTYTTAGTQPINIEAVVLRDSQNNDVPMNILFQPQYDSLPAKTNPTNISDPGAVYYEFQLTNSNLFTDVAGAADVTKYLVITYLSAEEDFVSATDTPAYPQEWYLALALGLSKLIAPMFNAPWTAARESNYKLALAIAQKKEPEKVVYYFQCNDTDV